MSTTSPSVGSIVSSINSSVASLARLITAGSYVAGLGFSVGAIMKFKQHKDNPTQIPVGTPAALDIVSAAALYLPSVSASSVQAAAAKAGVSASDVKAAAGEAGVTSSEAAAAEAAAKAKLS
jgi:intracellular multiplication protein IcmD